MSNRLRPGLCAQQDATRYVSAPHPAPPRRFPTGLPFSLVFRAEPGKENIVLRIASAHEAASKRGYRRRVRPLSAKSCRTASRYGCVAAISHLLPSSRPVSRTDFPGSTCIRGPRIRIKNKRSRCWGTVEPPRARRASQGTPAVRRARTLPCVMHLTFRFRNVASMRAIAVGIVVHDWTALKQGE